MKSMFIAIDTPELERAILIARAAAKHRCGVKLGLEFFCSNGADGVRRIGDLDVPIFLDLKLHDIPNTVAKAVTALAPLKPAIMTVHGAGGEAMLAAARGAAPNSTRIVAVTVLTSLDESDLAATGIPSAPSDQVVRLAMLARDSGIDGIVCSGAEITKIRGLWPQSFIIVPGVRPVGADVADQKRVVTPRQAIEDGASIIVIGRPITAAPDPERAILAIEASLAHMAA